MMKHRLTAIVTLLLCALAISAQSQDLPNIAVYVTGDVPTNEKTALGTLILASLVNSGRYKGIERSDAFLTEIDREQTKQRSGAIDDEQISELGKQFGVGFICIANITPAYGSNQVSARIVDVKTAEVAFIGSASSELKTMSDLELVSNEVVRNMFGEKDGSVAAQPTREPETDVAAQPTHRPKTKVAVQPAHRSKTSFGVRAGLSLNMLSYSTGIPSGAPDIDIIDVGLGYGIGLVMKYAITKQLSIDPEVGFYNRTLGTERGTAVYFSVIQGKWENRISEVAICVPILVQYAPIAGVGFYIMGGIQLDIPFGTSWHLSETPREGWPTDYDGGNLEERSSIDFGIAIGIGHMITSHLGIDYRFIFNVNQPMSETGGKMLKGTIWETHLMSMSLGVTYLF